MNTLPNEVRKNRFDYKLHRRETVKDRTVAIYKQYNQGDLCGLEVFIIPIRRKDVMTPTNVLLPAGEVFPGNEYFGSFAKAVYVFNNQVDKAMIRAEMHFDNFKKHIQDGL
jgi:hypothetical protein